MIKYYAARKKNEGPTGIDKQGPSKFNIKGKIKDEEQCACLLSLVQMKKEGYSLDNEGEQGSAGGPVSQGHRETRGVPAGGTKRRGD